jgi:hypothetical protein
MVAAVLWVVFETCPVGFDFVPPLIPIRTFISREQFKVWARTAAFNDGVKFVWFA